MGHSYIRMADECDILTLILSSFFVELWKQIIMTLKKDILIIGNNGMILMSSFLVNIVSCSVIQRLHKWKTSVSRIPRSNAMTSLLNDFCSAGSDLTVSLPWSL